MSTRYVQNGGLFVAVIMFWANVSQAQFAASSSKLSIAGGIAIPRFKTDYTTLGGGQEVSVNTGVGISGRYLCHTSSEWAFGGEISYLKFGGKEHPVPKLLITENESVILLEGLGEYTFNLKPENKMRLYFLGGLGYGRLSKKMETKPAPGYVWCDTRTAESRQNFDEKMWGFSISLGFGVEKVVGKDTFLLLEGRSKVIRASAKINDKVFKDLVWEIKGPSPFLVLSASLGWKFL